MGGSIRRVLQRYQPLDILKSRLPLFGFTSCKTTSSLSFFLVRRSKRARQANDHARDWRHETGKAAALVSRDSRDTSFIKSEEKERLLVVYLGVRTCKLFLSRTFRFLGSFVLTYLFPLFYATHGFYRFLKRGWALFSTINDCLLVSPPKPPPQIHYNMGVAQDIVKAFQCKSFLAGSLMKRC